MSPGAKAGRGRAPPVVKPEPARADRPFPEVFARVFPRLAELNAAFGKDGLLMVAVWDGTTVADYLHLPLEGEPEFAIVGRHDLCDLSLARDPAMSLRHAVVGARALGGELRLRFLDLRSGTGFRTEDGRRCEALAADGPMFLRVGRYHLFLLPTGSLSPLPWGRDADETWHSFPERVYRDQRLPARAPAPLRAQRRDEPDRSVITRIIEPPGELRPFRPAPGARGPRVGTLELASGGVQERFEVHEAEVDRGLLVGRYERCQIGADDEKLSRVHLLVIRDGDALWAVDTATTNGTTRDAQAIRRAKLDPGTTLDLAHRVKLTWTA